MVVSTVNLVPELSTTEKKQNKTTKRTENTRFLFLTCFQHYWRHIDTLYECKQERKKERKEQDETLQVAHQTLYASEQVQHN